MELEEITKHLMHEAKTCSSVAYANECNEKLMSIAAMVSFHKLQEKRVELLRLLGTAECNNNPETIKAIKTG